MDAGPRDSPRPAGGGVPLILSGLRASATGVGPGLANLVMGLVFGEWYRRTRRTMPLVVAHTLLDVAAFVGYALLKDVLPL